MAKTPTYALAKELVFNPNPGNIHDPPVTFPAGTLVFVFWNERYLTPERLKELDKARGVVEVKAFGGWMNEPRNKLLDMVMCMIGKYWVPVERKDVRQVD